MVDGRIRTGQKGVFNDEVQVQCPECGTIFSTSFRGRYKEMVCKGCGLTFNQRD